GAGGRFLRLPDESSVARTEHPVSPEARSDPRRITSATHFDSPTLSRTTARGVVRHYNVRRGFAFAFRLRRVFRRPAPRAGATNPFGGIHESYLQHFRHARRHRTSRLLVAGHGPR